MSYEEECIEAFRNDMSRQKLEDGYLDHFVEIFKSGFHFGSLNGAADGIKKWAVDNINPKKKKTTREMLDAIGRIKADSIIDDQGQVIKINDQVD